MSGALCEMLDFPASPCRHRPCENRRPPLSSREAAEECPCPAGPQRKLWVDKLPSIQAPNGRKKISPTRERSVVPEASVSRLLQTWGFSLAPSVASLHATHYAVASPPSRHTDQRLPYSSRFRRAGIDADGIKFHPALEGALFAVRSPPRSALFAAMIPTVES